MEQKADAGLRSTSCGAHRQKMEFAYAAVRGPELGALTDVLVAFQAAAHWSPARSDPDWAPSSLTPVSSPARIPAG